ncbi:MAG: ATP-grasp domain-containing protein [Lachnospiraceae bacterium]|nr:ATP-grasp domain-containing protein [Lachnospiraceae bacterium]
MFSKILIANRGEVAVRVIRACKEMGIDTVAVCSSADREALHTVMADESYCIGGPLASESYLNMDAILTVAKKSGADAIHPGYGMLAENPEFACLCEAAGITLIGPGAAVMEQMGQKEVARDIAKRAGVPVAEGTELLKDAKEAGEAAEAIGYPVILKARSGGGGRGIRIIRRKEETAPAFEQVKKEAACAFGDDGIFLEKYMENVKHIEVQILGDRDGHILVLGDRDCSVQRKNQKLIEECPAPVLTDSLRDRIREAARKLAQAVHYVTTGTVEFLVKGDSFVFLEMNTRLQVEHSVTEMVYGLDIVEWQIRTAAGIPLPETYMEPEEERHAIECRICAENGSDHRPSTGKVKMLHVPGGVNVRFDSALYQDCEITPYYDSLLGKLIVCADTRDAAIRKMKCALSEFVLIGVEHNREMHMKLMENEIFLDGRYDTGIVGKVL